MRKITSAKILVLLVFGCIIFAAHTVAQTDALIEGIQQYKQENYEEAAALLEDARMQDPTSSTAAFFLGLTYKQVPDYLKARQHLTDAVSLSPRIKEALVELVEVLYRLGQPDNLAEAWEWISVAEQEEILPAKIAFLKGLILQKEDKNMEAVKAFENAKDLDESFSQSAEFQIALCYIKEKDLEKAKKRFAAAVVFDPQSDLAGFARQYQDMVDRRMELEQPLHVTVGAFGQYNTNLLQKPNSHLWAGSLDNEKTRALYTYVRFDYVPVLKGPWLFNAYYTLSGNFNNVHSNTHDAIGNTINIAPGYNFGRFALNLAATYSFSLLRDPSYQDYSDYLSVGPLLRTLYGENNIFELFAGYTRKEYFQEPLRAEEDRDGEGPYAYISWVWLYKPGLFLNLRYEYTYDDTDGLWWENEGHRAVFTTTIPLWEKLKLQLSATAYAQDYQNNHVLLYNKTPRNDDTYITSAGLTYDWIKNTRLIAQVTKTDANSNIAAYDWEGHLYSVGLEYKY